jgi:hypothetical protein
MQPILKQLIVPKEDQYTDKHGYLIYETNAIDMSHLCSSYYKKIETMNTLM